MTPDDSTVDEAEPDAIAPAEAEAEAETDEAEDEEDEKARWRRALDLYLEGRLTESLELVDAILEANPDTDLRPRLERLRRRAADRIDSEPEEGDGEDPTESAAPADPPAEDEAPATETEESVAEAEAPTADAEAPAEDEAPTEVEAEAGAEASDEATQARQPSGGVVRVETPPSDGKSPKKQGRAGGVRRVVRRPAGSASTKTSAPSGPAKLHPNAATKTGIDKVHGGVENVAKLVRGLETNLVRIAEAYQRVTVVSKRKEQAYDQLYEELRTYKDNFLLSAQKPLFRDILLLYDGVSRAQKRFAEGEEQVSREEAAKGFQDILEEILEVLYRRDIERIEDQPDRLDIDFQKPVRRIETDDPSEDKLVDHVVRDGFRMDGVILRPQEVVVKRCLKEKGQS